MMRSRDPRIRQRINQISHNIESANETAQEGLYAFSQNYISPCLSSISNCINVCTAPCFPSPEDQLRRRRRGQAEANFDFYDDWDNAEEEDGLLGWGTGELDRLLAGSGLGRSTEQPRQPRRMSYGTRHTRRSTVLTNDRTDPTVIPSSSFLGFLERFPWRFGAKGVKYHPSAADLQEHPGSSRRYAHEDEPLMEATDDIEGRISYNDNGRNRSGTGSSRDTSNSLSSRGDLLPSDEEEDAVPLDDEFALVFARRGTGLESDDQGSKSEMVRSASGTSSLGDASSKKSNRKKKKRSSTKSQMSTDQEIVHDFDNPSIADSQVEKDQARHEELMIKKNRVAAQQLAAKRGLPLDNNDMATSPSPREQISRLPSHRRFLLSGEQHLDNTDQRSVGSSIRRFSGDQTEPFPPFSLPESPVTSSKPNSINNPGDEVDLAGDTGRPGTDIQ
ncbi:hypothetical protein N7520_001460 [Penicillium odoratum]|uniref:uncharacterized protein n=1 Tax=Penicillium odoratum TaxID=1167516 RepID=UPI002547A6A9|nr:uncharacterized protein N7520_001460 [Penicillium odoratum]KAJ5778214.1 hypothetical protein N7520_001460 [Penicillium odoratum]